MTRMTALPQDFQVSDSARDYCVKNWSLLYLPDIFLEDFKECFEMNGRKHIDWERTFKAYIRNSSPKGRFYNVGYWERMCEQARRYKRPEMAKRGHLAAEGDTKSEEADMGTQDKPSTWVPSDQGRTALKHIRDLLKCS